jgi:alkane 1-monooxygenase
MGLFFSLLGAEFWIGVVFFFFQSFIAFTLLEIINYIEHYGLHRRKLPNGKYERVSPEHSWNSNHIVTNLFLYQLQRHSDHHAHPYRPYPMLAMSEQGPVLPRSLPVMAVLALFPPAWRRVMDPRAQHWKDAAAP